MFPDGQDVAFLADFPDLTDDTGFWQQFYSRPVDKKAVCGIQGALHSTGSHADPAFFPDRMEASAIRHWNPTMLKSRKKPR